MIDIIFPEVEGYLKEITEFDINAVQLSSGKFACHKKELQLPKLIIGNRYVNTSMQYHFVLKEDCFYIVIPRGNEGISINGYNMGLNQPVVFTLGQEVFSRVSNDSYNFHIVIPTAELIKYVDEQSIEQLKKAVAQLSFGQRLFNQYENSQNHLCSLIDILLNRSAVLSYQAVLDAQETIIELLCKLLTLNPLLPQQNSISQTRKLAIVNRAVNHLHSSDAMNITTPELAAISFCCIRSLEYAFKSVLQMTPKQYLIKRRLNLIHSALKKDGKMSVSEIMENFGVVNQGRFAQNYFKLYNEYPHQTQSKVS